MTREIEGQLVSLMRELAQIVHQTPLTLPSLDRPSEGLFITHLGKLLKQAACYFKEISLVLTFPEILSYQSSKL